MNKNKLKLMTILLICLLITYFLFGVYYATMVPIESRILVITELHSDSKVVDVLKENLNGVYKNTYDQENYTFYIIDVNAPLIDILKSKELLKNHYVEKVMYEWEFKTKSPLLYEM